MNPIDPAELSAYLDDELSPARAREVEAAMRDSPALRAELDALLEADKKWRAAVRSASFRPRIRLRNAATPKVSPYRAAGALALLVAARVLPKLGSAWDVELIVNGITLVIVMVWVIRMTRGDAPVASA